MHTLSTLFPAAFPALALSHFVALLSPGPDFFCWSATPCATGSAAASDCVSASPQAMRCILCSPSSAGGFCARRRCFFAHRTAGGGLFIVDWRPADTQPSRDAGGGERSRSASGVRQAAAAGAGVIAAQPQKRPVLSGADDFPARAGCDPASANGERAVDGQRGVLLGFTAGERDCAAADTAPPGRHRLASRAGGGGDPDALRPGDYLAIFARPRRQAICLSIWKNSLN